MVDSIFKQMYSPSVVTMEEDTTEVEFSDDASAVEIVPDEVRLTFEEKLAKLNRTVMRHPLNREILYKALAFCETERSLPEAENYIAALPQFKEATQNQYFLLMALVHAYGLEYIERDVEGNRVYPDRKVGLTEDEIDDLVAGISFETTEIGRYFVEYNKPQARLIDLLNLVPERSDTYIELLRFVEESPRTYGQIESLLAGRPALETIIDGHRETMQPSVFVDKLERAGALIWNNGWTLTKEGKDYLSDLLENK